MVFSKRYTAFLIALFAMIPFMAIAKETTIKIDNPADRGFHSNVLFASAYTCSATKTIYYANQLNTEGTITGLSYTCESNLNEGIPVKIYLATTENTSIDTWTDCYNPTSGMTEVFSGYLNSEYSSEGDYKVPVKFTNSFEYDGCSNLVVYVQMTSSYFNSLPCFLGCYNYNYQTGNYIGTSNNYYSWSGGSDWSSDVNSNYLPVTEFTLSSGNITQVGVAGNDYYYLPFASNHESSICASIYSMEEMGGTKTINGIAYLRANSGSANPNKVDIYMSYRTSPNFSYDEEKLDLNSMTKVYSGSPSLAANIDKWEKIKFTTPFQYDGTHDLVVAVCTSYNNDYIYYYNTETDKITTLYYYGNESSYLSVDDYPERYNYRPVTRFYYEDQKKGDIIIGESQGTDERPYCGWYKYSTTQMVYPQAQIGEDGIITDIAFNCQYARTGNTPDNVKIYMGHKANNYFSSYSDFLKESDLQLVFDDTITLAQRGGWENIKLSTPFNYNGKDNLAIVVCKSSTESYLSYHYYYSGTSDYSVLYRETNYYSDYSNINYEYDYSTSYYLPDIKIIKKPYGLTIVNNSGSEQFYGISGDNVSFGRMTINDDSIKAIKVSKDFKVEKLTYLRTFASSNWEPLFLPFALDVSTIGNQYDIAQLNNIHEYDTTGDSKIDYTVLEVFAVKTGTLKSYFPYLIRRKSPGSLNATLFDTTIKKRNEGNILNCRSMSTVYSFYGTSEMANGSELSSKGAYILSLKGILAPATEDATLNAMRWYMTMDSRSPQSVSARKVVIDFSEKETTAISDINNSEKTAPCYDLFGRKTDGRQQGIYIKNGKKYLNIKNNNK